MNTLIIGTRNSGKTSIADGLQLLIKYSDNKIRSLQCELPHNIMEKGRAEEFAKELTDSEYYDEAVYVLNITPTESDIDILCDTLNITRFIITSRVRG